MNNSLKLTKKTKKKNSNSDELNLNEINNKQKIINNVLIKDDNNSIFNLKSDNIDDSNNIKSNLDTINNDVIENNNINDKKNSEVSYNKKLEIVKKINKIKKKEYLLNIFKIITTYSEEYTENTNGVFIFFHNLPDEVYEKIENYLNIIYKLHIKTDIKNIFDSEISDINISDTLYNNLELDNQNKDLTNKEKMILRRKKYEEYLLKNQI
jgi:hypothetical protein